MVNLIMGSRFLLPTPNYQNFEYLTLNFIELHATCKVKVLVSAQLMSYLLPISE